MLALVPRLAYLLMGAIGVTLRVKEIGETGVSPGIGPRPAVFAFWHRQILAGGWHFRNQKIAMLISPSFDGDLIARTSEHLGFVPVRGSSSRGGGSALLALERAYNDGQYTAFTADGPRGPVNVAKPGATLLAQRTGASVRAFCILPERAWQLNSWDRFLIPKPFSRVIVVWAQPVPVPAEGDFAEAHAQVQAAIERSVAMAEAYFAKNKKN